jgi:site-specific recombinase XerD
MVGKRPGDLKKTLVELNALEAKATGIIQKLEPFTFESFDKMWDPNRGLKDTVSYAFDEYIKKLYQEKRIGSALAYQVAKTSLDKFCNENKKSNYKFSHVTAEFLKKYEKWMLDNGNSITTVGIYLRSLRAIYNIAKNEGLISEQFYPFKRGRYQIPASRNTKKALSLEDIGKIYHYKAAPGSTTERMRDYWLFLYFSNGINVKDFCRLRYKNIEGDFLVIKRAKTETTRRVAEDIRIPLNDDTKATIKKYGNKKINNEAYIFPVLPPNVEAVQEHNLIQLLVRLMNDHLKLIAAELKIMANVTSYVARHSYASVLKRSGASIEYISETLGHSNTNTTKNYLASFEDDKKKEVAKALFAFKNVS